MDSVATECPAAEEDDDAGSGASCLLRVGRDSDWLLLDQGSEVRGANVAIGAQSGLRSELLSKHLRESLSGEGRSLNE